MRTFLCALTVLVLVAPMAVAVDPVRTDEFGNAEEPALRPVRWLWHGSKAFVYRFTHGFRTTRDDPRLSSFYKETAKGGLQSVVEVVESVARGSVHSVPPTSDGFKKLGSWNKWIVDELPQELGTREERAVERAEEAEVTYLPAPPGQEIYNDYNDNGPAADRFLAEDIDVGSSEREPEAVRSIQPVYTIPEEEDSERAGRAAQSEESLSRVEKAQRRFIGERARINEPKSGRGNLLRLAR